MNQGSKENMPAQNADAWRRLLDHVQASMFSIDPQYCYTAFNQKHAQRMLAVYGVQIELGRSLLEMIPVRSDGEKLRVYLDRALAGEELTAAVEELGLTGATLSIEAHYTPIHDESGAVVGVVISAEDVTESKSAEAKAEYSDAQYRSLFDNISSIIVVFDPRTGLILDANPAACAFFERCYDDLTRTSMIDLVEIDRELMQTHAEAIRAGEKTYMETTFRKASGEIRNLGVYPRIIQFKQGQVVLVALNDITEAKKAAAEIAFNASMLEQVHNGVIAIDFKNTILYWNRHAEQLYQWTREEAIGKNIIDLLSPEEMKETVNRNFASLNREGHWEGEFHVQRKDGSKIPAHITNTYLRDVDGQKMGFIGISVDITEREQLERALIQSEQRFQGVMDNMLEGILLLGYDWRYLYINHAAEIQSGRPVEELLGRTVMECWPGMETSDFFKLEQQVMQERIPAQIEGPFDFPNGQKGWFEWRIQPAAEGLLVITVDISERKQAEMQLQAVHDQLEQRVRERTAELQTANLALEKALGAKDEFMAAMSHELRTPLVGVLGLAQALQMQAFGALTERQMEALQNIEKSGAKLLALINDILDFSMLQSGSVEVNAAPCALGELCQSVLRAAAEPAAKKQQRIIYSIEPETITLNVDEKRLRQMLLALLDNASKFTPIGGELGLEVRGWRAAQQVSLTVWDRGIGIQAQDMPRLFQPFVQLDARLAREYEGTGLGLVIVQKLAEILGGQISMESVFEQGSRFTLTLPWID